MKSSSLFISFVLIVAISASKIDYSGHMVIRVTPETREEVEFLQQLQHKSSIDFWGVLRKIGEPADIHVSPQSYYYVAKALAEKEMNHNIFIEDVGKLEHHVEQQIALRRATFKSDGKAFDFENYHPYDEIMTYLEDLTNITKLQITTKVGGVTIEGRDIVQLTISNGLPDKQVIFFDCNIHAREWISPATCLWIIDQLVSGYRTDPEITALVDKYDWKFVPITNPDGYDFTWTSNRLWRKNRNPNSDENCIGVDINRNLEIGFGILEGASNTSCSGDYHGASAFSERESSALRDLIAADRGKVAAALSIHSYGQQWLSPYGYTANPSEPVDYPQMLEAMITGVRALGATYGTQYSYGPFSTDLYIGSGVTTDYYYVREGIVHSYTIELRDDGEFGFLLPPDQILETAIETWNGIKAMLAVM